MARRPSSVVASGVTADWEGCTRVKPVASVDVSKIQPKLTLAELRQPFLDRIEEAARKDPF